MVLNVSFISGGNQKKTTDLRTSRTNFITKCQMHLLLTKTRLDTTYCTNTLCMHWVFIQQTFRYFHLLFPNGK
jgi:hypothetical protein